ncbi:hypothetical protein [Pseudomonas sp.]|uniref:hypothetical protein n=1 Tax=Pseudomonas sp. TaxID=306 RepID=UPI003FD880A0
MRTKFSYSIQDASNIFADDLSTRSSARAALAEVKEQGFTTAKIYQEEMMVIRSRQVR